MVDILITSDITIGIDAAIIYNNNLTVPACCFFPSCTLLITAFLLKQFLLFSIKSPPQLCSRWENLHIVLIMKYLKVAVREAAKKTGVLNLSFILIN